MDGVPFLDLLAKGVSSKPSGLTARRELFGASARRELLIV